MAPPEAANGSTYHGLISSFRAKSSGDGAQKHKSTVEKYAALWKQPVDGLETGEDVTKRKENSRDLVNYYCGTLFEGFLSRNGSKLTDYSFCGFRAGQSISDFVRISPQYSR
jgi:hypothetical protein